MRDGTVSPVPGPTSGTVSVACAGAGSSPEGGAGGKRCDFGPSFERLPGSHWVLVEPTDGDRWNGVVPEDLRLGELA